jgi:hypothetical protein
MPWGAELIPVDELERLLAERRRPARARVPQAPAVGPRRWRPSSCTGSGAERAAGKSFGQIARELNASRVPTALGGARWWPSTVRSVLLRRTRDAAPLPSLS